MKKVEDKIIEFIVKNESWLSFVSCCLMIHFSGVIDKPWWQLLLFCVFAILWAACCGARGLKDRDDK